MSDRNDHEANSVDANNLLGGSSAEGELQAQALSTTEALDDIEGIDFLLEEIENKIAPLALA